MQLYLVKISGVYPPQCVTVTDSEPRAHALADAIRAHFPQFQGDDSDLVTVKDAQDFYPAGYTDADTNVAVFAQQWSDAQ